MEPDIEELAADMARIGVYEPGRNYNQIVHGIHGTGLQPPTEQEWQRFVKLSGVPSLRAMGELPLTVDHSASIYFPPVGNQGSEGSCVAYSMCYYIQSYAEAREHGWDLSATTWTESGGWPGEPASNQDRIFSPDFVYHQVNSGVDSGSNYLQVGSMIVRIGGATWAAMPYDDDDHTTWPSEAAFREAPSTVGTRWETTIGTTTRSATSPWTVTQG